MAASVSLMVQPYATSLERALPQSVGAFFHLKYSSNGTEFFLRAGDFACPLLQAAHFYYTFTAKEWVQDRTPCVGASTTGAFLGFSLLLGNSSSGFNTAFWRMCFVVSVPIEHNFPPKLIVRPCQNASTERHPAILAPPSLPVVFQGVRFSPPKLFYLKGTGILLPSRRLYITWLYLNRINSLCTQDCAQGQMCVRLLS